LPDARYSGLIADPLLAGAFALANIFVYKFSSR